VGTRKRAGGHAGAVQVGSAGRAGGPPHRWFGAKPNEAPGLRLAGRYRHMPRRRATSDRGATRPLPRSRHVGRIDQPVSSPADEEQPRARTCHRSYDGARDHRLRRRAAAPPTIEPAGQRVVHQPEVAAIAGVRETPLELAHQLHRAERGHIGPNAERNMDGTSHREAGANQMWHPRPLALGLPPGAGPPSAPPPARSQCERELARMVTHDNVFLIEMAVFVKAGAGSCPSRQDEVRSRADTRRSCEAGAELQSRPLSASINSLPAAPRMLSTRRIQPNGEFQSASAIERNPFGSGRPKVSSPPNKWRSCTVLERLAIGRSSSDALGLVVE